MSLESRKKSASLPDRAVQRWQPDLRSITQKPQPSAWEKFVAWIGMCAKTLMMLTQRPRTCIAQRGTATPLRQLRAPMSTQTALDWLKIGLLSFGGPAAQIAMMNRLVVEQRQWLTEKQFLSALSFCMLLPGPEAMQLATYCGWRRHGLAGGLVSGGLFVIPGAIVILALAAIYVSYGDMPIIDALFYGLKTAVLVVVIQALVNVSKRALKSQTAWLIAIASFVAIFFFNVPFPVIVTTALLLGFFFIRTDRSEVKTTADVSVQTTLLTTLLWLFIWLAPLALVAFTAPSIFGQIGQFFSTLAVVSFGGAYAVLDYIRQDVVIHLGWISDDQLIIALGLAETTPGPLILVTEFVAFLAAFNEGGQSLLYGIAGALVALWVTFAPCFLWIFVGAPYVEWIGAQARLSGALTAVAAAVVGVILNLSLWFGLRVLFADVVSVQQAWVTLDLPLFSSLDGLALAVFLGSCFLAFRFKASVFVLLSVAAVVGGTARYLTAILTA